MYKILQRACVLCLMLILTSCNNGATTPSSATPATPYAIGVLPDGSVVYASNNNVNVVYGTTAPITLSLLYSGSNPGTSYTFTAAVNVDAGASVSIDPDPCILVSGSSATCSILFNAESAYNGTYLVTISYVQNSTAANGITDVTPSTLPNPITFTVSANPAPTPTMATLISPVNGSESANLLPPITVHFDSAIDPDTVSAATFKLGTTAGASNITAANISVGADNESATFTIQGNLSSDTNYYVTLTNGIHNAFGTPIQPFSGSFTTKHPRLIFIANNNDLGWSGNLLESAIGSGANPGSVTTGVQAADYLCQQTEFCQALNGKCKAMLVDSGNTRSAVPPIDWVFESYTEYVNTNSEIIGITGVNPSGFNQAAVSPQVFAFDLQNRLERDYTISIIYTGLTALWQTQHDATCNDWTKGESSAWGIAGALFSNTSYSIHYSSYECKIKMALACVEQP